MGLLDLKGRLILAKSLPESLQNQKGKEDSSSVLFVLILKLIQGGCTPPCSKKQVYSTFEKLPVKNEEIYHEII